MPRKRSILFEDLVEEFITKYSKERKKSWREDERCLTKYWGPKFQGRMIHTIERREVVEVLEGLKEDRQDGLDKPRGPILNRYLAILRKMFNWAMGQALTDQNPCYMIGKPVKEVSRQRVLEMREFEVIFEHLYAEDNEITRTLRMILTMMILTAARRSEVCGMAWSEVDLKRSSWSIPHERAKNGEARVIPLSTQAVQLLTAWKEQKQRKGNPYVFPSRFKELPKHISPDSVNHATNKLREATCLPNWRPHDLRRSAGTHMRRLGCERAVLKLILGHKSNDVTAIYDRYDALPERQKYLQAWADEILETVDLKPLLG